VLVGAGYTPARRTTPASGTILELREERALEAPETIAQLLVEAGAQPTRLAVERETLEDHFVRLTAAA